MYAPNTFQGGLSVSHLDTILPSDEFMEPNATPTSDDRYPLPLLKDVGRGLLEQSKKITIASIISFLLDED